MTAARGATPIGDRYAMQTRDGFTYYFFNPNPSIATPPTTAAPCCWRSQAARRFPSLADIMADLSRPTVARRQTLARRRRRRGQGRTVVDAPMAALLASGISGSACAATHAPLTKTGAPASSPTPHGRPPPSRPSAGGCRHRSPRQRGRRQTDPPPATGRATRVPATSTRPWAARRDVEGRMLASAGLMTEAAGVRRARPRRRSRGTADAAACGSARCRQPPVPPPDGFYGLTTILLFVAFIAGPSTQPTRRTRRQASGVLGDRCPETPQDQRCSQRRRHWHAPGPRVDDVRGWTPGAAAETCRQKLCLPASAAAAACCADPCASDVCRTCTDRPRRRHAGVTLVFDREGWSGPVQASGPARYRSRTRRRRTLGTDPWARRNQGHNRTSPRNRSSLVRQIRRRLATVARCQCALGPGCRRSAGRRRTSSRTFDSLPAMMRRAGREPRAPSTIRRLRSRLATARIVSPRPASNTTGTPPPAMLTPTRCWSVDGALDLVRLTSRLRSRVASSRPLTVPLAPVPQIVD